MDLPSGDQAMELIGPWRGLICLMPLTASVQTKMLFWEEGSQSVPSPEQSERKASCLPLGDQAGCEAVQAPGRLLVTSPIVSGERTRSQAASWGEPAGAMPRRARPEAGGALGEPAGAMAVRWSSEPRAPLTVQASERPSGEMATVWGVRTRARFSRRESMRGS